MHREKKRRMGAKPLLVASATATGLLVSLSGCGRASSPIANPAPTQYIPACNAAPPPRLCVTAVPSSAQITVNDVLVTADGGCVTISGNSTKDIKATAPGYAAYEEKVAIGNIQSCSLTIPKTINLVKE